MRLLDGNTLTTPLRRIGNGTSGPKYFRLGISILTPNQITKTICSKQPNKTQPMLHLTNYSALTSIYLLPSPERQPSAKPYCTTYKALKVVAELSSGLLSFVVSQQAHRLATKLSSKSDSLVLDYNAYKVSRKLSSGLLSSEVGKLALVSTTKLSSKSDSLGDSRQAIVSTPKLRWQYISSCLDYNALKSDSQLSSHLQSFEVGFEFFRVFKCMLTPIQTSPTAPNKPKFFRPQIHTLAFHHPTTQLNPIPPPLLKTPIYSKTTLTRNPNTETKNRPEYRKPEIGRFGFNIGNSVYIPIYPLSKSV